MDPVSVDFFPGRENVDTLEFYRSWYRDLSHDSFCFKLGDKIGIPLRGNRGEFPFARNPALDGD